MVSASVRDLYLYRVQGIVGLYSTPSRVRNRWEVLSWSSEQVAVPGMAVYWMAYFPLGYVFMLWAFRDFFIGNLLPFVGYLLLVG